MEFQKISTTFAQIILWFEPSHHHFHHNNTPTQGKIQDTNSLNLSHALFCCMFWDNVLQLSPCVINFLHYKNICYGSKKVVAKSRVMVYFAHARTFVVVMPPSWILTEQINQTVHCISLTNIFAAPQVDRAS